MNNMNTLATVISTNFENVQERIIRSSLACGRDASQIKLVVVSKMHPVEVIRTAIQAGARFFGENYPEESLSKIINLADVSGIEWHMIGHLQSRKARLVAEHFDMIQSLDSVHLAEKLDRVLDETQKTLPVLLEFNVSGEESKYGWPAWQQDRWDDLLPDVSRILHLTHLNVVGLMTMPPLLENPEDVRPFFIKLRSFKEFLARQFKNTDWKELSMGTSSDFEIAIEEGATIVRVGQAILGPRPENNHPKFRTDEGV